MWRRPVETDSDLKDAAKLETERVKAAVRLLELSIERNARRSLPDLERELRDKYKAAQGHQDGHNESHA